MSEIETTAGLSDQVPEAPVKRPRGRPPKNPVPLEVMAARLEKAKAEAAKREKRKQSRQRVLTAWGGSDVPPVVRGAKEDEDDATRSTVNMKAGSSLTLAAVDLTPATEWRARIKEWQELPDQTAEERLQRLEEMVYGVVLRTGASIAEIVNLFAFPDGPARRQLGPVVAAARAELALSLKANQIKAALKDTAHPIAMIWAGKNFAGQSDNGPVSDAVPGDDVKISVSIVRKEPAAIDAEVIEPGEADTGWKPRVV